MAYTPKNLEQLRRSFVADRSSVRWVEVHRLIMVDNVATWRPLVFATPPTITMLAGATA